MTWPETLTTRRTPLRTLAITRNITVDTAMHKKRALFSVVTMVVAAVLCFSVIAASPALAETANSLPGTGGHTCTQVGADSNYTGVLCLDLGLYTTRAGQQFLPSRSR
jgi:uncharacterized YccA/Bax inhibitor family protein